jgi:CYTH domain-containing protein
MSEIMNKGLKLRRRWVLKIMPNVFGWEMSRILKGYVFADKESCMYLRKESQDSDINRDTEHFLTIKAFGAPEIPEWETRYYNRFVNCEYFVDTLLANHEGIIFLEIEFKNPRAKNAYTLERHFGEAHEITGNNRYSDLALALNGLPIDRPFQ